MCRFQGIIVFLHWSVNINSCWRLVSLLETLHSNKLSIRQTELLNGIKFQSASSHTTHAAHLLSHTRTQPWRCLTYYGLHSSMKVKKESTTSTPNTSKESETSSPKVAEEATAIDTTKESKREHLNIKVFFLSYFLIYCQCGEWYVLCYGLSACVVWKIYRQAKLVAYIHLSEALVQAIETTQKIIRAIKCQLLLFLSRPSVRSMLWYGNWFLLVPILRPFMVFYIREGGFRRAMGGLTTSYHFTAIIFYVESSLRQKLMQIKYIHLLNANGNISHPISIFFWFSIDSSYSWL